MRSRFVWSKKAGDWVPAHEYRAQKAQDRGPAVHKDYEAFVSPETGEVIDGRRAYRDHLKRHDLVCLGNERLPQRPKDYVPVPVADTLRRVWHDKGYRDAAIQGYASRGRLEID